MAGCRRGRGIKGQGHDAGAVQHLVLEVGEVRRRDERLHVGGHVVHERRAAHGVQLAHDVIKQQHGLLVQHLFDDGSFGQLEGQHDGPLLALAARTSDASAPSMRNSTRSA